MSPASDDSTPLSTNPAELLRSFAVDFDVKLEKLLDEIDGVPDRLREAMGYALLAPGKRMRPFVVTQACIAAGGAASDAFAPAAAIECVHAFSLVHDDLPAMDDDDLRRGRPTVHKKFDEATAILAGDALLSLAFEVIATRTSEGCDVAWLVGLLAEAVGGSGMIGGQMADIEGQGLNSDLELTRYIHERKTARLFEVAAGLGGLAAKAGEEQVVALRRYGLHLGLAFQIADDLLDVTATAEQMGKAVGKDAAKGKQTYPACVGKEESVRVGVAAAEEAVAALSMFGDEGLVLSELAKYAVSRNY